MAVEIKICGMTCREDIEAAVAMGADYVGFVMYPPSPRSVTSEEAAAIVSGLGVPVRAVGVFVNEHADNVRRAVDACGLHAVQLHGEVDPADYRGFSVPVWRALRIGAKDAGIVPPDARVVERLVLDAAVPGLYGGTGVAADWPAAAAIARRARVMLAGGLTPENVAAAIDRVQPLGVDVASGVESRPGRKDHARMRAFIDAVRTAMPS